MVILPCVDDESLSIISINLSTGNHYVISYFPLFFPSDHCLHELNLCVLSLSISGIDDIKDTTIDYGVFIIQIYSRSN